MNSSQRVILVLLAISLIAGVTTGNQIYYRLSYLWALLFFGGWLWSVLSLRKLHLTRTARALRAQVGQVFEERFDIHNESRIFRLWLEVRNESPLPGSGGSQVLTLIGGRQKRVFWSQTLLTDRGVFPLGPTVLASGDLFGLFPRTISTPAEESLLVYPLMADITDFPNPPGLLPGGEAIRRRTNQITPNASGVREYAPGDPLNRIHWLSTARRNRLMVKEFELDPLAEVWIFLDADRSVQAALPRPKVDQSIINYWRKPTKVGLPPATEEYGVSIAASLTRLFLRRDQAVGLVSAGQRLTLLPPDRGGRQFGKILDALALSKAEGELPLRGLLETEAKHVTRGSTVVLITPIIDPQFALVIEYLLRRGLRPVVILLDAASFGGSGGTYMLAERIRALGVAVRVVKNGDDLAEAIAQDKRGKAAVKKTAAAGAAASTVGQPAD